MTGAILNAVGILLGGALGLLLKTPLSAHRQQIAKVLLGVFCVVYGLRLTWVSLNGSFLQIAKQLAIVLLAMILGKLTGRLLGLQKISNRLGQRARDILEHSAAKSRNSGFNLCTLLFCAAPLAVLGSVHDGLSGYFAPLAVKAVMDALATMSFVLMFGWVAMLSALPVFVYEGTLTLLVKTAQPFLARHELIDPINATGGLLVFTVALVILEIKRIDLADYLPSLCWAAAFAWLLR